MLEIERDAKWSPPWVRARQQRASAEDLLRVFEVTAPPVPVERIVREMGVELHRVPDPGWDGALRIQDGKAVIWVNGGTSPMRQRFTIAHELGHLVLHNDETMFRDHITLVGYAPKEREANAFAADLLMPRRFVRAHMADRTIDQLASLFEVSKPAMKIRYDALRLGRTF